MAPISPKGRFTCCRNAPAPFCLQIPPCHRVLVGKTCSHVFSRFRDYKNLFNHECIHDARMFARRHAPIRSCDLPNWCGHLTGITIAKPSCSKTHLTVVRLSSAKHFTNKNTAASAVSGRFVWYIPRMGPIHPAHLLQLAPLNKSCL